MAGKSSASTDAQLAEFIAQFYGHPYEFVLAVFPWGEPYIMDEDGNQMRNPLADKAGPEPWQRDILIELGEHVRNNMMLSEMGLQMLVWRSAIASGHGVGKSALVAWVIYWLMSTRVDTRGAVTASTQFQLEDKTWPELAKWHNLAINKHWFLWTATGLTFAAYPEDKRKNYKVTAATVSEQNTEAFAGLHNEGRTVFVIFDEASGVASKIWEVAEGALTDGEGFFFAFGNPTRSEGEFADCFDKHSHMYYTRHIDSREVSHTNKTALQDIINKYGIDSDEVKVRIRGLFPSQSFNGFIPREAVEEGIAREVLHDPNAAIIMAVDVARFGDDETVIGYRQGRDARSRPFRVFKGLRTTQITEIVAREADLIRPDAIVIESTGPGAGVIDQLKDKGYKVHEVHPGSAAVEFDRYVNKRAEYWSKMRDALYDWLAIPDDPDLVTQLTGILYALDRHEQRTRLEAKEDMKKRGLKSPDRADTLALTFAVSIARRDRNNGFHAKRSRMAKTEYDPHAL